METETTNNAGSNSDRNYRYHVQKMLCHFSAIGTAIESFAIPEAQSTPGLTVSLGSKIKNQNPKIKTQNPKPKPQNSNL